MDAVGRRTGRKSSKRLFGECFHKVCELEVLADWEEQWERAQRYLCDAATRAALERFVADVRAVGAQVPEFAEQAAGASVEFCWALPQLFALFCAAHGHGAEPRA